MRASALVLTVALALAAMARPGVPAAQTAVPPVELFLQAAADDDRLAESAMKQIADGWKDGYATMIVELAWLVRGQRLPTRPDLDFGAASASLDDPDAPTEGRRPSQLPDLPQDPPVRARLLRLLREQTKQRFGRVLPAWQRWTWTLPYEPHPDYARFKGLLYSAIDPDFEQFFPSGVQASIRLDEISWGGVPVNGIPPLYYPKHIPAGEASYLRDGHVVFGIFANGEARAYPRRILAWHEMAIDKVGGDELTIVYCTLCGTVIPYESVVGGRHIKFGTSGLLYQSNKLMFDEETHSLWSTLEGKPVVGSLVDSGLELRFRPVVTTTWEEWKREHPETTVLSLDTGHRRDYSEGAAYRDYFSTDNVMFQVSKTDRRLRNKAEVLVMTLAGVTGRSARPVAIAADFLRRRPIFHFLDGDASLVVVTSPRGANRVYRADAHTFERLLPDGSLVDSEGRAWSVTEDALIAADGTIRLARQPAHRTFWFGWYAQFPDTTLIK